MTGLMLVNQIQILTTMMIMITDMHGTRSNLRESYSWLYLLIWTMSMLFLFSVNNNMIHHDNVADITNADPRPGQDGPANITLKLASWNCQGLKSNMQYASKLANSHDIVFLCETWLKPSDLNIVNEYFETYEQAAHMISSVDPLNVLSGRPFGGIGFIIRNPDRLTYRIEECHERIIGLKVYRDQKVILNVFGVYMPHNGHTQMECFLETLDKLQSHIDNCIPGSPVVILGELNTSLPAESNLTGGWFKQRPYSKRSLVLYNFLSDNDMCWKLQFYPSS